MVYSNKFIMCVLVNGRPQKELANGVVSLPFGTEYALRFRNKNDRRAVVKIFIDGENVSGDGFIVKANSYTDIERHHDIDRAFKFVDLESGEAVEHGKNGPNHDKVKGTIEARFYLEKEQPKVIYRDVHHDHHHHHHHDHYHPRPVPMPKPYPSPWGPNWTYTSGGSTCDAGDIAKGGVMRSSNSIQCSTGGDDIAQFKRISKPRSRNVTTQSLGFCEVPEQVEMTTGFELKDGCTVEGNMTGQKFRTVFCETEETYTSLKIFLQGYGEDEEEVEVVKPKKKRKTNKDRIIDDLEDENDQLRQEIEKLKSDKLRKKRREDKQKNLEETNEKLKKELEELQKE